jgi:hypothetical protein
VQRLTGVDVEVQVLRVLIRAEIRQDPTRSVFAHHVARDSADHGYDLVQECLVRPSQVDQRWNVPLRNDNDMDRPEWTRVAEGQNVVGLHDDLDGCPATESFVAVEIPVVGHFDQ